MFIAGDMTCVFLGIFIFSGLICFCGREPFMNDLKALEGRSYTKMSKETIW